MRGTKVLIEGASATILQGQKVGIIGRNGCGKSTLFAAIQGELAPDLGTIGIPKNLKIATVAQKTPALPTPAIEYVMQGDKTVSSLLSRRDAAYAANDGEKIALIEDELGVAGFWTLKARAGSLLFGLGFGPDELEKPIAEFSGGWRMRLNLAQALIYQSDLLLLDEPTNHLDLDTVLFLQNFLKNYEGTLLCISHDRDFLDSFADHILHFEEHKVVLYPGNYSAYEKIRAERIRAQKAARKKEEAILAHMQSFVERFRYKATKAKQAQSLLKAIDRMQLTAVTQEESPFSFSFPEPERTPQVIASLKELDAGYQVSSVNLVDSDGPMAHHTGTGLSGNQLGIAAVEFGLHEDDTHLCRSAGVHQCLQPGRRRFLAPCFHGNLPETVVAGKVRQGRMVNHEGTVGTGAGQ